MIYNIILCVHVHVQCTCICIHGHGHVHTRTWTCTYCTWIWTHYVLYIHCRWTSCMWMIHYIKCVCMYTVYTCIYIHVHVALQPRPSRLMDIVDIVIARGYIHACGIHTHVHVHEHGTYQILFILSHSYIIQKVQISLHLVQYGSLHLLLLLNTDILCKKTRPVFQM